MIISFILVSFVHRPRLPTLAETKKGKAGIATLLPAEPLRATPSDYKKA
jgi:hypothetical protein